MAVKGLGRGLGALIANEELSGVVEIDINKIEPNASQPRKRFEEESLQELADSIKEFGIIQPLIVKKEENFYTIIAGERRWRAARLAKMQTVPVLIKDYNEIETLEVALIENIQRADLNPVEEAVCYKRLAETLTQDEIARKVGKNRPHISNSIRLLSLDARVQTFVSENMISMGHAKALLALEDGDVQFSLAEAIIEDGLTVRKIEELVAEYKKGKPPEKEKQKGKKEISVEYRAAEEELRTILKTKVAIKGNKGKGNIVIGYYSPEELDRILIMLRNTSPNHADSLLNRRDY